MPEISSGLERLELHDSTIENLQRTQNALTLELDWCKLTDFIEGGITQGIIIGRAVLRFEDVSNEWVARYGDNDLVTIENHPVELAELFQLISQAEINSTGGRSKIAGLDNSLPLHNWVEWMFNFGACSLTWNSHVLHSEWLSGMLPQD